MPFKSLQGLGWMTADLSSSDDNYIDKKKRRSLLVTARRFLLPSDSRSQTKHSRVSKRGGGCARMTVAVANGR